MINHVPRIHHLLNTTNTSRHSQTYYSPIMGDTRPIPSPNDAQLERLTSLTERAHRRSRQRNKIAKEETRILDAKEQIMAVNQFDYATQRQLNQMVGQLERLNDVLIDVLNEEEMDAIEEERIWSQMG
ncbi:hypothetical protein N7505_002833 [Penicillium chrysogenum]|uniref:BZIP domain-containing protein n=1 Tax=Penicillium chrysogenum TaxID=5076 RepID=A0ABQ8WNJ2_PENCH|nr:hypothetical protein N7505_002833 [Penicillium chrysogenum]